MLERVKGSGEVNVQRAHLSEGIVHTLLIVVLSSIEESVEALPVRASRGVRALRRAQDTRVLEESGTDSGCNQPTDKFAGSLVEER